MFISKAYATSSANSAQSIDSSFISFIPLILIFLVFYFLIIRPQQKRLKEHKKTIDLIKNGDTVVTSGGIIGEVTKVDETNAQFVITIAPKVEVKVLKSSISEVLKKKIETKSTEKSKIEKENKKDKDKLQDDESKNA
ncbi:preprotein translocase subunit YajC [Wolbachia endosymbiont of Chironomus riparius]|uniref:preprotein translocase subunit YajC n=1 Tax=Wolbachia endosymbiont of Chironomus riparius TaxID=2883238 RepID=UPI00209DC0BC|nr:preprotein translocase subunit YajC [Wolbachia endosymbiont of Chironomus riparius]